MGNEYLDSPIKMRGLIMAGGNGTRLFPLTQSVNKHLLPIFDKPMIYYPLTTLMLAGIREIAIVIRSKDVDFFEEFLGNGSRFGVEISFLIQDVASGIPDGFRIAREFIGDHSVAFMLGDNLLIGQGLGRTLGRFTKVNGAQIFAFPVKNPSEYGVVEISKETGRPVRIVEKPDYPRSNLAIPGLYFFDNSVVSRASTLEKSKRNEYEITDLLNSYLNDDVLQIEVLERGMGWMDAGTIESLYGAGEMVRVLQERQGLRIGVPEEVGLRNGWLSATNLMDTIMQMPPTEYSKYLKKIVDELA
jgi:glucose-1-phosphate thymidylyltransferase